jgi:hypothetical protein
MPRVLNLIERLAIAAAEPISSPLPSGSRNFSAEEYRLIEAMLRHPDPKVQQTALNVLSDAGPGAEPLKRALLEIARGPNAELSLKAIGTLAAIGAGAGPEVEPILLSKRGAGTTPRLGYVPSFPGYTLPGSEIRGRRCGGCTRRAGAACLERSWDNRAESPILTGGPRRRGP